MSVEEASNSRALIKYVESTPLKQLIDEAMESNFIEQGDVKDKTTIQEADAVALWRVRKLQ